MADNINSIYDMYKFIMGATDTESKLKLLKLFGKYKKIKSYNEYKELEDKIYEKYAATNDNDKIKIELQRINLYLKKNNIHDYDINNSLLSIAKTFKIYLEFINKSGNDDATKKEIINNILSLELDLGMKIALYNEYCNYFEELVNDKYHEIKENDKNIIKNRTKGND